MNAPAVQAAPQTQPSVSQEYLLLSYIQRLDRHRAGRRAVHIHLSNLRDHNRRNHHLRIAGNTFEGLVQQFDGQMFNLNNGDLIFVCKDASVEEMDDAVMRLRYLFSDDPLALTDVDDNFSTWYNVEAQYDAFLAIATTLYEKEQARQERIRTRATQWGENEAGSSQPAISPAQLGKLEEFLQSADLSSFVRRQQVCALAADSKPRRIFKELYISIDELAETVLPGVSLLANKWLFQHLTQTLDQRVLKLLSRADDSDLHSSFSVNLNVNTLLSSEFLEFDSQLRMGGRGTIVIEVQLIDVFADFSAFVFARDFMREKGYRICVDGITHRTLPLFDRKGLGVDIVKMFWDKTIIEEGPDGVRIDGLREAVERCGKSRVILCRCDTVDAVQFGQKLGITMYQGRLLDSVLHEEARFGASSVTL